MVEKRLGHFAKNFGLPVEYVVLMNGPEQAHALAAGDVQFLPATGSTSVFLSAASGAPFRILGIFARSPRSFKILAPKDSPLARPEDLRGKTVAGPRGTILHELLALWLAEAGMTVKDVEFYGFNAYFKGDTVAFVRAATMERFASATVRDVRRISDRIVEVRFDRDIPTSLELNHDCVENMTCTPEVEIRNCYFTRTSTRGTLVTTPRKVVIENNTYYKTGMSAILIEADAEGWYESGPVKDVLIKGNTFIDCAYNGGPGHAVIAIHPSNKIIDAERPVHQNIRIEDNTFRTFDYPVLYTKSTAGLLFRNNTIVRTETFPAASGNPYVFYLNGCKKAVIEGTVFEGETPRQSIKTENMKRKDLKTTIK